VSAIVLATCVACALASAWLAAAAWRRRGVTLEILRSMRLARLARVDGGAGRIVYATAEPVDDVKTAPFTERPVLYVRATLSGRRPDQHGSGVLWQRTRTAATRLVAGDKAFEVDLAKLLVVVPRDFRHGTLRALVPDIAQLPTVLARAGYTQPPASSQWFHLEEEVVSPGAATIVWLSADGTTPVLVSTLPAWKLALRLAWGPALALVLSAILAATSGVLAFAWRYWLN